MKLFLANSPSDYPNQFPPLGLLYLASAARNAGHVVAFYDLSASNGSQDEFFRQAEAFQRTLTILKRQSGGVNLGSLARNFATYSTLVEGMFSGDRVSDVVLKRAAEKVENAIELMRAVGLEV